MIHFRLKTNYEIIPDTTITDGEQDEIRTIFTTSLVFEI